MGQKFGELPAVFGVRVHAFADRFDHRDELRILAEIAAELPQQNFLQGAVANRCDRLRIVRVDSFGQIAQARLELLDARLAFDAGMVIFCRAAGNRFVTLGFAGTVTRQRPEGFGELRGG